MEGTEFNRQAQAEAQKEGILMFMKSNLFNIYRVCSKTCATNFTKGDLSDKEKICLSKCFDRKSESFANSMTEFNRYAEHNKEREETGKTLGGELKFE